VALDAVYRDFDEVYRDCAEGAQAATTAAAASQAPQAGGQTLCPYDGETVTFNAFAADVGIKEDKNSPVYQIFKKAVGNIEIEWELVPFSDFFTKGKIYLNSGEIPDLIWYASQDLMKDYASSGMFLDFNKYKDYMPNWTAETAKNPGLLCYEAANGELFTINEISNDYPLESFVANKTLLDSMGIAIPNNLKELEDAMAQIRAADASVTPFHTGNGLSYDKDVFGASLNARTGMYFDLSDRLWKHAVLEPGSKYKDLIALMANYYEKGYLNPEFSTMSQDQTEQLIASDKWAFTYTYSGQVNVWYKVDNNAALPIEAVPLLPLAAEGVKPNNKVTQVSDSPIWGYSASANVKNPELACSLLDTLFGDEVSAAFQWGEEGTSYTVDAGGKKAWIPEFLAKGNQAALDLGIWNILLPRYVTKRDDTSSLQKASPLEASLVTLLVDAIESGEIDAYYYRANPMFTDAESEELSTIMTAINTKIDENEALFILGKRDISEWDDYIEEVKALGDLNRAVEIYNSAKQSLDRKPASERTYIRP
jgi:putative aldouronate transport system substrate-binding protein